jgi:hypothetical protein
VVIFDQNQFCFAGKADAFGVILACKHAEEVHEIRVPVGADGRVIERLYVFEERGSEPLFD